MARFLNIASLASLAWLGTVFLGWLTITDPHSSSTAVIANMVGSEVSALWLSLPAIVLLTTVLARYASLSSVMPIIGAMFAIGAFALSLFPDFYAEPSVLEIVANATGLASASSFAIEVGIGFVTYQVLALVTAVVLTLSLFAGKRQPTPNKPDTSEVSADSQSLWDDQSN